MNTGEDDTDDGVDDVEDNVEDGEEDGAVDFLDKLGDDGDEEDVVGLVPMLLGKEEYGVVDLLVVDETSGLILEPCGGYREVVIGAHCCPGCDAHMHVFCGDTVGEEEPGYMRRCPGCR